LTTVKMSDACRAVREFTKANQQVDFGALCERIFGVGVSQTRPVQRAIIEAELVDCGWRRRPRDTVWERG
jgi:hypothetical protein